MHVRAMVVRDAATYLWSMPVFGSFPITSIYPQKPVGVFPIVPPHELYLGGCPIDFPVQYRGSTVGHLVGLREAVLQYCRGNHDPVGQPLLLLRVAGAER